MNKEFWESLPEDIQGVISEYFAGHNYSLIIGATLDHGSEVDVAWFKEKGDEFYTLPPDEKARWFEGAIPNYEKWYQQAVDNGITWEQAEAMVAAYRTYVDKYTANPLEEPDWFGYAGRYGSPRRPGGWD